ncbi:MAG TPA: ATP-binding cassette domain-containing protein [Methanomassiliicoccales archaeon]|nr:ATP-binding cassette domain-containing protein [Methanomassiliicoccales archaeon]HNX47067.1 ATP-binding cassette domain-containing protein [Methanomassiliicoccales archaeon]HPR97843.1 ATP-binding cassette domain-containing protein [Methanomassiliicoccales archaeon]
MPAVRAEKLTKVFDELRAVDAIDFQIEEGECFGFLGPNGAGKSTTMRMMHCASPITSGKLEVLGMDVNDRSRDVKAVIGVAPQENNLDPDFTVRRNLTVYGRYFGLPKDVLEERADRLLEFMQLSEKRDERIQEISGGMKRRLIIARAMMNDPRLLILDEPTTGLDPQARHLIWEKVRELKRKKVTVILTTHYMDEAERLCDRLVIMDHGKIILEGKPRDLIDSVIGTDVMEIDVPTDEMEAYVKGQGWQYERTIDRLLIFTKEGQKTAAEIKERFAMSYYLIRNATLEDVFLRSTGRALVE